MAGLQYGGIGENPNLQVMSPSVGLGTSPSTDVVMQQQAASNGLQLVPQQTPSTPMILGPAGPMPVTPQAIQQSQQNAILVHSQVMSQTRVMPFQAMGLTNP